MILLFGCKIQKAEDYYQTEDLTGKDTVTIVIRCDTILDNMNYLDKELKDFIPQDGVLLKETLVAYDENMSAYDALMKAAKKEKLVINTNGTDKTTYIVGINGIKEFSCGELSGWMYQINHETMSVSCGEAMLKKDDVITFLYTCDLGQDIEKE